MGMNKYSFDECGFDPLASLHRIVYFALVFQQPLPFYLYFGRFHDSASVSKAAICKSRHLEFESN